MKKKIMAVLLVCAVFFSLGCAGAKNNDAPASTPVTPTVTPETDNNDPVVSATPQATGDPTSGPVQETGTDLTYIDPSLADIGPDEEDEFFNDIGLPTPGAE